MKPLIVILGPTASGKSALSISLAKKYRGEIICADSRTIYKGLLIGAASPTLDKNYQEVPHHLLHFVSPNEVFTVAQFKELAEKTIAKIHSRGKIPFLVGGTGLYIDAITKSLDIPRIPPDFKLRDKLEKLSNIKLAGKLKMLDKKTYAHIDQNNKRRLVRALEVCLVTKKPFSSFLKTKKPSYQILKIGLALPKEKLFKKIDARVSKMIKMGLVDEVRKLITSGCKLNAPAMSGLGYKQIASWLCQQFSISNSQFLMKSQFTNSKKQIPNEIIKQIKIKTKQYAKRQMTWFKRDRKIVWIKSKQQAEKLIKEFCQTIS